VPKLRLVLLLSAFALGLGAKLHRTSGSRLEWLRAAEGWIPSFAYAFGIVLVLAALPNVARMDTRKRLVLLSAAALGAVGSELYQRFQPGQTFAWSDLAAAITGGAAGLALEAWMENRGRSA
jgi:hypothetical protein